MITTCSTCGTTPTLYIANGRQFCKAHKADAEALLRPVFVSGTTRNIGPRDDAPDTMHWHNTHKRDRPLGIVHYR